MMNLQHAPIVLMTVAALPLTAQDSVKMPLPQSGGVVLSMKKGEERTTYELALQGMEEGNAFWKHEVPVTAGPPMEWSKLLACDEKDGKVVVLLELNEMSVMLVQYDTGTKEVRESRMFAAKLLQKARFNAGTFKLQAPDILELVGEKGDRQSFLVKDGQFWDEEGSSVEQSGTNLGAAAAKSDRSNKRSINDSGFPQGEDGAASDGKKSQDSKSAAPSPSDQPQNQTSGKNDSVTFGWKMFGMCILIVGALIIFGMVYRKKS